MTSRPLVTILFTDVVASTQRAVELGDRRWKELLERHHQAVRQELRRFGGREVNTAGDGFIATFERPDRAVQCACAIRDATADLGLAVRAGLHTGQVEGEGRSIGGIAVHVAARVAAEGGPGDVIVSRSVHDAIEGGGFTLEDAGSRDLKGVPGDRQLYRVTGLPAGEDGPRAGSSGLGRRGWIAAAGIAFLLAVVGLYVAVRKGHGPSSPDATVVAGADPAIAIVPFTVQGEGLEMWREGMVDVLSANLDGIAGLRAIDSRTVLARWRETISDGGVPDTRGALEIARRTGARYALVGSVVASGSGMRVLSDLYDLEADRQLGEPSVEGSPDSIFRLVDRLSIEILRSILAEDHDFSGVDLARATTSSLPALKAFLEGEALYREGKFARAIPRYRQAVEADSTFGQAYYRLARSYGWGVPDFELSAENAERAFRLADELPERDALLVRGLYAFETGQVEGLEVLRAATRRYPDDPEAWDLLGDFLYHHGGALLADPEEGRRALARAIELDPGFASPYIHRIDQVMRYAPDSALVAELIDREGRLASGAAAARESRAVHALAFGSRASRANALAVLDTLTGVFLPYLAHQGLSNPRFMDQKVDLLGLALDRHPSSEATVAASLLVQTHLARGELASALGMLDHPVLVGVAGAGPRIEHLYQAHVQGYPIPEDRLDRALDPATWDTLNGEMLFYAGAWAIEQGEQVVHRRAVSQLFHAARRAEADGDTHGAEDLRGALLALGGFVAWKRNDLDDAFRKLDRARVMTEISFGGGPVCTIVRWWLAEIEIERGRLETAERYFLSLGHGAAFATDPVAVYRQAEVQHELGRTEDARANYEYFLSAFREPDPALRPWVEDARQTSIRLRGLRRE